LEPVLLNFAAGLSLAPITPRKTSNRAKI